MPEIRHRNIGIAADMFGCPNCCRHCYIGKSPNGHMTEDDLRWSFDKFRSFIRSGEDKPFFDTIDVVTWRREPDFSDDYRRLYELEVELSDVKTYRAEWELMSIWRLAHDESYAPWARSIGIRTCQTTFFGAAETQDWFYRRKGAFQDCIIATERLLDAGIKPRWQIFFTKKIIPEFGELMRLIDQLKLRERCAELGGEFVMFTHTPGWEGEGINLEDLTPTIDDVNAIPGKLIEATLRHDKSLINWKTVGERVREILACDKDEYLYTWSFQDPMWFIVKSNGDIYPNRAEDPWWKLGNLHSDSMETIIENFEHNKTIALHTIHNVPLRELAKQYGDPDSRLIDGGVEDLWLAKYCAEIYRAEK